MTTSKSIKSRVGSSFVRWFRYNRKHKILTICFKAGIYRYSDVPLQVYGMMLASYSKGAFFNKYIKDNYQTI